MARVRLGQQIPAAVVVAVAVMQRRPLLAAVAAPVVMFAKFLSVPVSPLKHIQLALVVPLAVEQQQAVREPRELSS